MNNDIVVLISHTHNVEINKPFYLRVRIPKEIGFVTSARVLINKHGESPRYIQNLIEETKEEDLFQEFYLEFTLSELGQFFFFFQAQIDGSFHSIKLNKKSLKPYFTEDTTEYYWRILVVNENSSLPEWAKGKLVYQLFVDRFFRSISYNHVETEGRFYRVWNDEVNWRRGSDGNFHNNDFFRGNLKGIIEKIPYFTSLGVGILYLSPINYSKLRYDHYAVTDYSLIDPDIGNFEILQELYEKAHASGIKIILDIALNHCSIDNVIFKKAKEDPNSEYRDWFYFHDNGLFKCWEGFIDMPEFNQQSQGFRNYIYGTDGIITKLSKYVDGFRLDVAELLDPSFMEGVKKAAVQNEASFIVGECWNEVPLHVLGKSLDSFTCYQLTNATHKFVGYGEKESLEHTLARILEIYPQYTLDTLLFSLDTHDIIRAITILGKLHLMCTGLRDIWTIDKFPSQFHARYDLFDTDAFREFEYGNDKLTEEEYKTATKLLKLAAVIQYFLIGNPCLYYGTEAGLYGFKDPWSRKPYPWNNLDEELISFFQELGTFRQKFYSPKSNPRVVKTDSDDLFVFTRENKKNKVLVAVNRSNNIQVLSTPQDFQDFSSIFSVNDFFIDKEKIEISPFGSIIILISGED